MPPRPPIPLTLVTGFLGAGKTTLLNRLLSDPAMAGTLVIVNEFGDVGLDHLFLEAHEETVVELSSGCLCCTIRGDFTATLERILRDLDNHRLDRLTRIVVETTGLADPAPILNAVMLHPYLALRFSIDGVVTLVDAVNGAATLDAHEEARRQVAVADRLVLTKTELADKETLERLLSRLAALNPAARRIEAADRPAPQDLMGGGLRAAMNNAEVRAFLGKAAQDDDHHHHGHHHHHHDPNRHGGTIRSFVLTHDGVMPERALGVFLDLLRARYGAAILRLKGIVETAPGRKLAVHMVQGLVHPPVQLADAVTPGGTRIVVIGEDLDETAIVKLFQAAASIPAPDTPDAAALTDNPLAPPGLYGG